MISAEQFYGGAVDYGVIADDVAINTFVGRRVIRVAPTTPGWNIELPATAREGGPHAYIINDGSESVDVESVTIDPGEVGLVLRVDSTYQITVLTTL